MIPRAKAELRFCVQESNQAIAEQAAVAKRATHGLEASSSALTVTRRQSLEQQTVCGNHEIAIDLRHLRTETIPSSGQFLSTCRISPAFVR
jgi:hypothetical protein